MRGSKFIFSFLLLCIASFTVQAQQPPAYAHFSPHQIQRIKQVAATKENARISFASRLTLFVLLSPECPLCKNYSKVLNKIHEEFGKDLNIYGIVPGKAYSVKEVNRYATEYKIEFPIYIDKLKQLTTYLNGTVTPEVILLNKEGELVYRGAIDDWVTELGKNRLVVSNEYLKTAITQYLANLPVSVKSIEPKGCLINEF